jgi:uncharacterized protein YbjT (DUF2867 family)
VFIAGGTGMIGSAVLARLARDGHEAVAVVRPGMPMFRPQAARLVSLDVAKTSVADWLPHLGGIDAVVNCAGVLQDSPRDATSGVNNEGASALFEACERSGIQRVVHLSAIGVDRAAPTPFSRSKLAGDKALMTRNLDWVILRPSVVVGRTAYGGSALFRGMAALPVLPVPPDTGPLQLVQLDDLVLTISFFLRRTAPSHLAVEIVGPERLHFGDVVRAYRRWLGWPAARTLALPPWVSALLYRCGDAIGWLGWRSPMRSTARKEIGRGAVGDPDRWMRLTGIIPLSLEEALAGEPASVQERWFARLYFLKPVVLGLLSLFWLVTGVISLGPGWSSGPALLGGTGLEALSGPLTLAGGLADVAIGTGIACRRTSRAALIAAVAISVLYLMVGTVLLPGLWADPLGRYVKVVPIIVLTMVALAILGDR